MTLFLIAGALVLVGMLAVEFLARRKRERLAFMEQMKRMDQRLYEERMAAARRGK
jgi:hypothetical protein